MRGAEMTAQQLAEAQALAADPRVRLEARRSFADMTRRVRELVPEAADQLLGYSVKKHDAIALRALAVALRPKRILEVGSYCGVSTRWWLESAPDAVVH